MTRLGDWKRKTIDAVTGKPDRFSWVIENELAGSALPQSIGAIQWAISQGIKSIVTIREEPLADNWIKDVNYLYVMSNDMGVPEFNDLTHAVDFIHRRITNKEPVLVHCLAGMGRTGVVLACYLVKYQNMSADEATQKIRDERPGSIQSYSQEEIIFRFEKSLKR